MAKFEIEISDEAVEALKRRLKKAYDFRKGEGLDVPKFDLMRKFDCGYCGACTVCFASPTPDVELAGFTCVVLFGAQ